MSPRLHHVTLHRASDIAITAMELTSNHSFPRHSHDEYGIGVVLSGAQRSWSGVGTVESVPGDVITVNPGEMHDGHPISGAVRRWRIIYFDPGVLKRQLIPESTCDTEFASPCLTDYILGRSVNRLFKRIASGAERLGVEEIVTKLVSRLADPARRSQLQSKSYSHPVRKALARIDDNPSQPTTLAELAALSGMSRYQIVRAFGRELGATP
jgi:hypothetical protein